MSQRTADYINALGKFCGMRDVFRLSRDTLRDKYGFEKADVMVLFGGSILAGGDVLAEAIKERVADHFIIVGGAGHTTETLRSLVHREYPSIETAGLPEAEVFQRYLQKVYGCSADQLETESTNCGNNITNLLALLEENHIDFHSIILCQDATMQRRMDAVLRKYVRDDVRIINYASYAAAVVCAEDRSGDEKVGRSLRETEICSKVSKLRYSEEIHGMWDIDRYLELLMGEIPRLTDDEAGYGPNGKGFIAHVDIPEDVRYAFEELKSVYGDYIRAANPKYASR